MDETAIERARERLAAAAGAQADPAAVDATLERARAQLEALAQTAAELEATLPGQVQSAVETGLSSQVRPVARNLAEVRGLMNQVLRRLERVEGNTLVERNARVDDLALLVDLIASGWSSVEDRLAGLERRFDERGAAIVYRIEDHVQESSASTLS